MIEIQLNDPQTLYRRWEDQQWSPFAVDLSSDKEQWQALDPEVCEIIYFAGERLLPGFVEGYSKIHHDEQRHIGYGVWFLREAVGDDPALAGNVRNTLRSLLPAVAESLTPPDREGTDWAALGASAEEIRDFAITGLSRRLKIVGVPLDSL